MFGKKEEKTEGQNINSQEKNNEKIDTQDVEKSNNEDEKLKLSEEENKRLKDTLMRTLAELENTRRIASEENEKTSKYAISRFAEELIPVMEDFYLAFENIKDKNLCDEKNNKIFFDGIKLTQSELKKVFERNGLIRIFPLNDKFDPDFHDAISQIESDEDEGEIIQVLQAGYKIKDRLLRPALVCVSKCKNN